MLVHSHWKCLINHCLADHQNREPLTTILMENNKIDFWAIVEIFGHQKIAGKVSEQSIAGTNMLRVDVPDTGKQPAHTKYYGGSAIYAINPVDEETARLTANQLNVSPISIYNTDAFVEKWQQHKASLPAPERTDDEIQASRMDFDDDLPYAGIR